MTSQNNQRNSTDEALGSHLPAKPASYHPAALASATDLLRRAVSPDAAVVFSAIAVLRPRGSAQHELDLATLASLADLGSDPKIAAKRLFAVDDALFRHLGVRLVVLSDDAEQRRRNKARGWLESNAFDDAAMAQAQPSTIILSDELCALLDAPHPVPSGRDLPVVDTVTATWVEACRAAARSGTGHHLALRVLAEDGREVNDFAGLVAADGSRVDVVSGTMRSTLIRAVLRAELHAGESGHVVVVAGNALFEEAKAPDDDEHVEASWTAALKPDSAEAKEARLWLPGVRNTYVWQAPATGALPRAYDGLIGGCAGPTGFDRTWSEGVVAAGLPGLDKVGVAALLAQVRDPRDALAMASMARAAASGTGDLRAASTFVARSFGARTGGLVPALAPPAAFDPRLLVCDHDVALLLLSAPALAQHGGRVLFWGPPGGGKSSFAQALARGMPGHPALSVTPADVLAYRWGAMERRLANIWTKAASEGAVLVVDELDSLCGAREGGSGNNAYLIRCLTDEWLRHLDAHPSVPVLATVNDPAAVDDAIRRGGRRGHRPGAVALPHARPDRYCRSRRRGRARARGTPRPNRRAAAFAQKRVGPLSPADPSKARPRRNGSVAEIVVASCTGLAQLSGEIGLPLVHVDAALDADAAIQALNTTQHGCAAPWPHSFQPLLIEEGWTDWKLFPLEVPEDAGSTTPKPWIARGRLRVLLPGGVPLAEFRSQLAGALRHLRLQEVTLRPDFLERRCEAMADLVIPQRYTLPRAAAHDYADAVLTRDLYVLDPAEVGARPIWLIEAARNAAIERPSSWG